MNFDPAVVNIINGIKQDILSTRNRIFENANRELITMYYRIGRTISENSKYGNQFVETLSSALKLDFPDATGYSSRNLFRMKKFYEEYKQFPILPPPVAELPWTHNCILIEKEKDLEKRMWYAEKTLQNGWSKVVLDHQMDLMLYERQADNAKKLSNFPDLMPKVQGELASDMLKDPYVFELAGLNDTTNFLYFIAKQI